MPRKLCCFVEVSGSTFSIFNIGIEKPSPSCCACGLDGAIGQDAVPTHFRSTIDVVHSHIDTIQSSAPPSARGASFAAIPISTQQRPKSASHIGVQEIEEWNCEIDMDNPTGLRGFKQVQTKRPL